MPILVVAESTPPLAWSGPFNAPTVRLPLNVLAPVNTLLLYVFGIVLDAFTKLMAEVVEKEEPVFCERKKEAEEVEKALVRKGSLKTKLVQKCRP